MDSTDDRASDPTQYSSRPNGRERIRNALDVARDAVTQAIAAPRPSLESIRRGAVRYGAIARDQAMQLDDVVPTLMRGVRATIDALPSACRAEMAAAVQWWAVHGYHRAD